MISRRTLIQTAVGAGPWLAAGQSFAQIGALAPFDPQRFTELRKTITTGAGQCEVVYRFYKAIPYVARPVDAAYQSLNISVPVFIDGKPVDARGAPILLANGVGGYMPSTTAAAAGVAAGGMGGPPPGGMPPGAIPLGAPPPGALREAPTGSAAMLNQGRRVSNAEYALAAGYVVVEPGARGRTLVDAQGRFYGVAPAAIVDLKAAVRWLRANKASLPGNTDRIVSSGTSAGGALSALLGATGDSELYAPYLRQIGAAETSDTIFAVGTWCPITDLEHADMAYEWNWGANPLASGVRPDADISAQLNAAFPAYQASLGLTGGGAPLTAASYGEFLRQTYLLSEATAFLTSLGDENRTAYLAANPNIRWADGAAKFTWPEFLAHVGPRKKAAPSFDAFDLSTGENSLFGAESVKARHFTTFGARGAPLDPDMPLLLELMNPMPFLQRRPPGRARHWWIRVGAKDTDTSLSVVGNLAAAVRKQGDSENTRMYWDAGHGANNDPDAFVQWIGQVTGYA